MGTNKAIADVIFLGIEGAKLNYCYRSTKVKSEWLNSMFLVCLDLRGTKQCEENICHLCAWLHTVGSGSLCLNVFFSSGSSSV